MTSALQVSRTGGRWQIVGEGAALEDVELCNDYLAYLADRRYSSATVRAYASDLLHFARWLKAERIGWRSTPRPFFATSPTAGRLRSKASTTTWSHSNRPRGWARAEDNQPAPRCHIRLVRLPVHARAGGRRPGPERASCSPLGQGERAGLLGHLAHPKPRSKLRVREPRRFHEPSTGPRSRRCWGAFAPRGTGRSPD